MLHSTTLDFLKELAHNNNREWFYENKPRYETAKANFGELVGYVIKEVSKFHDLGNLEVKDCVFRINRDVRFSKDKSPYKLNMSAGIGPGGRSAGKIDYYLHIQPDGKSFLGSGMWAPTPEQIARYRQEVDYNAEELKKIIHDPVFSGLFPEVHGAVLKTMPKGYPKDHPEIELLKRKELFFTSPFSDQEVLAKGFAEQVVKAIEMLKPFCDYMNYVLYLEKEE